MAAKNGKMDPTILWLDVSIETLLDLTIRRKQWTKEIMKWMFQHIWLHWKEANLFWGLSNEDHFSVIVASRSVTSVTAQVYTSMKFRAKSDTCSKYTPTYPLFRCSINFFEIPTRKTAWPFECRLSHVSRALQRQCFVFLAWPGVIQPAFDNANLLASHR